MRTAIIVIAGLGLVILTGCAAGRGPAGEIILGVEVGTLVDTAEQALIGGVGMIPGVGPFLQNMLMGAVASGATVGGVSKMLINKLEKRRKVSDMAREVAESDLAVAEAKLEAANGSSA